METKQNQSEKPTIIVDTREQTPYLFDTSIFNIGYKKLDAGDYQLKGDTIIFERKTIEDFVNTVIHHWDRFARELIQLSRARYACVVIEASIDDIRERRYYSKANGNAVLGRAVAITKHGVKVFFAGDRISAIKFITKKIFELSDYDAPKQLCKPIKKKVRCNDKNYKSKYKRNRTK